MNGFYLEHPGLTVTGNTVHPVNTNEHSDYTFYVEVFDTCGNSPAWFGEWKLSVGCSTKVETVDAKQNRYQEVELNGNG